jgi:hypothetical protein
MKSVFGFQFVVVIVDDDDDGDDLQLQTIK